MRVIMLVQELLRFAHSKTFIAGKLDIEYEVSTLPILNCIGTLASSIWSYDHRRRRYHCEQRWKLRVQYVDGTWATWQECKVHFQARSARRRHLDPCCTYTMTAQRGSCSCITKLAQTSVSLTGKLPSCPVLEISGPRGSAGFHLEDSRAFLLSSWRSH